MLIDVVQVKALGGHRLWLAFEDGISGEIDLVGLIAFDGIFAPLSDAEEFARVRVDAELGTITWPNGADLAPEMLYQHVVSQGRRLHS